MSPARSPKIRPIDDQQVQLPPEYRHRRNPDGTIDDTFVIEFTQDLDCEAMRRIAKLVLETIEQHADVGMAALATLDFRDLRHCTCSIRSTFFHSDRLNAEFELLHKIHQIRAVNNVDGITYSFLGSGRIAQDTVSQDP